MLSVLLGVQLLTREVEVGERQVHTSPQALPGSPAVAFPVTEEESSRGSFSWPGSFGLPGEGKPQL